MITLYDVVVHKSQGLVSSEADMANYVTHKGVTRDCWSK